VVLVEVDYVSSRRLGAVILGGLKEVLFGGREDFEILFPFGLRCSNEAFWLVERAEKLGMMVGPTGLACGAWGLGLWFGWSDRSCLDARRRRVGMSPTPLS